MDKENICITFDEAKIKFIEQLENEIEKIAINLKKIFKVYSYEKRSPWDLNIILGFDFDETIRYQEQLKKSYFVIQSLKKLDLIKINKYDKHRVFSTLPIYSKNGYNSIVLPQNPTNDNIRKIQLQLSSLKKLHWSNTKKIKYSTMEELGELIINNKYIEFQNLMNLIVENKILSEKYTRLIFGKAKKHK